MRLKNLHKIPLQRTYSSNNHSGYYEVTPKGHFRCNKRVSSHFHLYQPCTPPPRQNPPTTTCDGVYLTPPHEYAEKWEVPLKPFPAIPTRFRERQRDLLRHTEPSHRHCTLHKVDFAFARRAGNDPVGLGKTTGKKLRAKGGVARIQVGVRPRTGTALNC